MKRKFFLLSICFLYQLSGYSQSREVLYIAHLIRPDGIEIPFQFTAPLSQTGSYFWNINNGKEHIRVDKFEAIGDSVRVSMPLFESYFMIKRIGNSFKGRWVKGGSQSDQIMAFSAEPNTGTKKATAKVQINGKWAVVFTGADGKSNPAIGEFIQKGDLLTGTFLTTTGDYRYLGGSVNADSFQLYTFDGGHAFLFTGKAGKGGIKDGKFYSGLVYKESWFAKKDAGARMPENASAVYLRKGEERISFAFPDLSGDTVRSNDRRFKDKVVIVQIMGSWCPNCMDETAFLSDFYNRYKSKGLEIVSLAYELTLNKERSVKSLLKFKDKFQVQYPMLITDVTVNDSLRTEKTLPQLTPIKMFPTTIIIGKDGIVRKIDTGFVGPGTGSYFDTYRKKFTAEIEELLQQ
ncbi:MAG TPA: TlpA disulfide reductase family protein [Flavisolibacter sp.]|jgi:thiol-disulfide isomerase/thioredoxin|nr:TlpA disulfide reductase family protein [Flavisolibacter sp.]